MARSIWSGAVSFGLVNVPVKLYSATHGHEVHFYQFAKGTSSRIRHKRVNEDTGREVEYDDIVKGADLGNGRYAILTPEELGSVEPGKSRTIDISDFVEASEICPIYYQKSYYLAPADKTAEKAYSLLREAMTKADKIGIATFVMRDKQYLAAIRPQEKVLVLETMFFADEVRDPGVELDKLPTKSSLSKKDLDMAVNLVETLTVGWDPANYRDTYTERVEKLIQAKRKNREVVIESEADDKGQVLDLMEALQASVDSGKKHKAGNAHRATKLRTRKAEPETRSQKTRKKGAAKKTAAKKSPAKKRTARKSTRKAS